MKLLFVTGSRSEWGYIRPIIRICEARGVDYGICATNMLLLPGYGSLIDEIRTDGYKVSDEIFNSLEGHNHITMLKSLGVFLISFADTLHRIQPTWVVLAGDRAEQLMASIAAAFTYIPMAHIQAGERSGNIDGVSRHAIGKFAHIHCAANEDAAERLRKLGEEPFRVHTVGAPQIDELVNGQRTPTEELAARYDIDAARPFLLVIQHPVTEEMHLARAQVEALSQALTRFEMPKVWILPNNDAGSSLVRRGLMDARTRETYVFENLSRRDFLGFMAECTCIVGNSSAGLLEAPTYKVAAVNLGRRQADRVQGTNVINASFEPDRIEDVVNEALSPAFQERLRDCVNPYGDGRSSERILRILQETPIDERLLVKKLVY